MKRQRSLFVPGILSLLLAIFTQFAPPAMSQANVQGQWKTLPYTMPVNPVHVALLYNGKVVVVSGSGNVANNKNLLAALWDPQAGTVTTQPITWDMFCNGMVVLPDGRPFVLGGTLQYDPFFGHLRTSAYDPASNAFAEMEMMAAGRWYPTGTVVGDGRVLVFGGFLDTGHTNTFTELYTLGAGWGPAIAAPWTPPLYPRMHLLPNGNVFYSGSTTTSNIFNPSTNVWTMGVAHTNFSGTRTYGSSVLLPLTPANGYTPKVMILGGDNPSTATTEIIDLSATTPKWVNGPNMSQPRVQMNATILPTGKVLALGGSLNDEDTTTASLNADLYDPNTNTFSSAGTEAFARLYHSVSLLMPDATVWVAGSNPSRGNYEPHMEIYSPAYLFKPDGTLATRPTITSVSSPTIGYGDPFQVQTPDAASISTVVLMRNGACTHSFNTDQRYVGLSFTTGSGVLNATAPPNGNIAPPGYYMLFLLNNAGVPSVAQMVQISKTPNDQAPTGTITSPASDVTIQPGQSVSFAGTGSDPDGTVASFSWAFPGGNPSSSSLANPGSVTYTAPGTYVATLTVTDNSGLTDPRPPTRTITVPDYSVTASPGSQSIAPGSGTTYTATVNSGGGFTSNVALSVSGLPAGATASFNPTSLPGSGSSTLTVSTTGATPPGDYSLRILGTSATLTHSTVTSLVILQPGGATPINFGSGFTATGMQFNGHTKLSGTRLQLTDLTAANEIASAFWASRVNVQAFDNNFTFQVTKPVADGFTFTIQGVGPTAIGLSGSNLGYAPMPTSLAVKFDLHGSNGDDGQNSTGLYINGTAPTTPSNALGGGINLLSGDTFHVQMTYDGTTLTMNITDDVNPNATFTMSWPINIPTTLGSTTAFVGFTASTGGGMALQEILDWSYTPTTTTPTPDFSIGVSPGSRSVTQGGGTTYTATITPSSGFAGNVSFSVSGLPTGASGSFAPTSIAGSGSSTLTVTTTGTTATGTYPLTVTATSGALTHTASTSLIITQSGGTPTINFSSGFSAAGMKFNGHTKLNGTRLQLTDSLAGNEVASAFWTTPVSVTTFTTDITFQLTTPNADGFTFTIQGVGPTAIGLGGSNLGYGGPPGIGTSVAVKFDLHSNAGEGVNSTGLYTNGATPTVPATTLGGGVNLHSGDIFQTHVNYDGTTLSMTITDTAVPADIFTITFPINIPTTVGASTAFVGFTAGTGGSTATQEILNWTYTAAAAQPDFSVAVTPSSQSIAQGGSTTYTATITPSNGFTDNVSFSVSGLPTGASGAFVPTSVAGSGSSTLTVTTTGTTATGTYPLTVTATSGTLTHTASTSLVITAAAQPDFSVAVTPSSQSIIQGGSTTYTATITPSNGFTDNVSFSVSGLPTGASGAFVPTSVAGTGSSTLTVTTTGTTATGTYPLTVTATAGTLTHTATTSLVITQSGGTPTINLGSGFSATGMKFNGHTKLNGTRLQLTDSLAGNEVASAFWTTPVSVTTFTSDFTFQLTTPNADGFTFTIQGVGATAIGLGGSNLGYGGAPGIGSSVAVKFDLHNNAGEGVNSTGLYTNGAAPTVPATTFGGGVNLHSGDIFQVHLTYDGTTLSMTITDTAVPADTFTITFPINIPTTVGASTAFVGFTAGTGGSTATQEIIGWTYSTP
jgi:hypothetical protein